MKSRPAAAIRPRSTGFAAGSRHAFRRWPGRRYPPEKAVKLSHGFERRLGGIQMTLASLSTADWHARAAAVRYETGHFIDGRFVDSAAKGRFTVVNPATGSPLCEVSAGTAADIDLAVAAAKRTFSSRVWSRRAPRDRMAVMAAYARLIEANAERFALLDTLCMGKPITDMVTIDVPAAARNFAYFGELIDKIDGAVTSTAA